MYGFEIRNGNDEIVISDSHKIYQLFEEVIHTGTYIPVFDCYIYPSDFSSVEFANVPIGSWIGKTLDGKLISDQSTMKIRRLKVADTIVRPAGEFGMKLFNSQGELTYCSNSPVGGTREYINSNEVIFDTPLFTPLPYPNYFNREYSWFCITTTWVVSGIFNGISGTGVPTVVKYSYDTLSIGYVRFYTSDMLSMFSPDLIVDSNCRMTLICA